MMVGACGMYGGRTEKRKETIRPRRRWEVNIKVNLKEFGFESVDWIDLTNDTRRGFF